MCVCAAGLSTIPHNDNELGCLSHLLRWLSYVITALGGLHWLLLISTVGVILCWCVC